jgi:hypothetical protein
MTWELKIKKADNGYILEHLDQECEGPDRIAEIVVEEKDDEFGELEAMVNLLFAVKEYFGVHWSKHNKKNVEIKLVSDDEEGV